MDATETDWRSEQERDLYEAAGIDPADLPEQTRSVVRWLAGWDQHVASGLSALLASAWHEGYATGRKDAVDHYPAELRGACAEVGRALAYLNIDRGARGYITDPHGHRELDMVVGWLSTAYEAVDGIARDLAEGAERASISAPSDSEGGNR